MAVVQVVIRAIDQLSGPTRKAGGALSAFKGAVGSAGIVMAGLTATAFAAKKVWDATAGSVMAYNKSILDSARATGTTTDQMSRIVQVADDYEISIEEVTRALEMMTKNGVAPSIDNLANLFDELNGMGDPTKRAAAAAKLLGRNWAVLDPIMRQGGEAFREAAGAISDGLVVTEAEAIESEKLRIQIDSLRDSAQSLANTVGTEVIPEATSFVDFLNRVAQGLELSGGNLRQFLTFMRDTAVARDAAEHMETLARKAEDVGFAFATAAETAAPQADALSSALLIEKAVEAQIAGDSALAAHYFALAGAARKGELRVEALTAAMERSLDFAERMNQLGLLSLAGVANVSSTGRRGGAEEGFQGGGSFIVPGVGRGDRPYAMNLEPGEGVQVIPRQDMRSYTFNNNVNDGTDGQVLMSKIQQAVRRL